MFNTNELVDHICKDIEKKYHDRSPLFYLLNRSYTKNELISFLTEEKLSIWLNYKKTSTGYTIKHFPPISPRDTALREAKLFLDSLDQHKRLFQIFSKELYDDAEVLKELVKIIEFTQRKQPIITNTITKDEIIIYQLEVIQIPIASMLEKNLAFIEYTNHILSCYAAEGKGYVETTDLYKHIIA